MISHVPPPQGPGLDGDPVPPPRPVPHVIYEAATGRIVASGMVPPGSVPLQPGQLIMQAIADPRTHYVKDGVLFLRTALKVEVNGRTVGPLPKGTFIATAGIAEIVEGFWTAPFELGPSVRLAIDHPAHLPLEVELRDYRADRADAYPPKGDQLDAIWKFIRAAEAAGLSLPTETQSALARIADVKASIPKD